MPDTSLIRTPHESGHRALIRTLFPPESVPNSAPLSLLRLGFRWEQRRDDFNRYYRLPSEFGPSLPVSIHLAGQQRTREVGCWDQLAEREWERKVVVDDTCFYTHRKGQRSL